MSTWGPLVSLGLALGGQLVLVGVWIGRATSTLGHLARAIEGLERRIERVEGRA